MNSDAVALAAAEALKATKLMFITTYDGIRVGDRVIRQMPVSDLESVLAMQRSDVHPDTLSKAIHAAAACKAGVPRVHVINGAVEEGLLAEVFTNEGVGTLIYGNNYQQIRSAREGRPRHRAAHPQLHRKDELAPRSRATIEKHLGDYYIFEMDKNPIACVALHTYPDENKEKLACLTCGRRTRTRASAGPWCSSWSRRPASSASATCSLLDAGLQLLPGERRLRRGDARRPAARPAREVRRERPPVEGAGQEADEPTGLSRPSHSEGTCHPWPRSGRCHPRQRSNAAAFPGRCQAAVIPRSSGRVGRRGIRNRGGSRRRP